MFDSLVQLTLLACGGGREGHRVQKWVCVMFEKGYPSRADTRELEGFAIEL